MSIASLFVRLRRPWSGSTWACLFAALACGPPQDSPLWTQRPSPVLHLAGGEFTIRGDPPARKAELARWSGDDFERWDVFRKGDRLRIESPTLEVALARGVRLRATLRPGGATRVSIFPLVGVPQKTDKQRKFREIVVSLERDADPDRPVTIEVDLTEATRGNWMDHMGEFGLRRLEFGLDGADPARAGLDAVVLETAEARYAQAAAGGEIIDRGGILRPGFFVNAGAAVEVRIEVPPDAELRWHESGGSAGAVRRVRLHADGERKGLARGQGIGGWLLRRASLAAWGGREVTLEFSVSGEGVAFFGDPRVVVAEPRPPPPDVLVYMIDTLRADRLAAYGRQVPGGTPTLDGLAEQGVRFENAFSNSSWTKPAIPTLMTGIWPTTHRVGAEGYSDRLPLGVPLLQERFRQGGWRTGSFSASPLGSTLTALERGFDAALPPRRWKGEIGELSHPSAEQLHAALLGWIREEPDRPFFAYVHTLEVHEWYQERFQNLAGPGLDPYDAAVRLADRRLGGLLEALAEEGRSDGLLIVVVSDHGESFGEHGDAGHGSSLYQSQLRIPIVFWARDLLRPETVETPVGLADVPPTLLDLMDLPPLSEADGRSLAPLLLGRGTRSAAPVPGALLRYLWEPDAPQQFSLITPELEKIIRVADSPDGRQVLYDLAADPGEQHALDEDPAQLSERLDAFLEQQRSAAERFRERYGSTAGGVLDAADVERLRALGYLE